MSCEANPVATNSAGLTGIKAGISLPSGFHSVSNGLPQQCASLAEHQRAVRVFLEKKGLQLGSRNRPFDKEQGSGDFCYLDILDDGRALLVAGDVAGRAKAANRVALAFQDVLRRQSFRTGCSGKTIEGIFAETRRAFESLSGTIAGNDLDSGMAYQFLPIVLALFDTARKEYSIVNAGMPLVMALNSDGPSQLILSGSIPLMADYFGFPFDITADRFAMIPNGGLFFSSDGYSEKPVRRDFLPPGSSQGCWIQELLRLKPDLFRPDMKTPDTILDYANWLEGAQGKDDAMIGVVSFSDS